MFQRYFLLVFIFTNASIAFGQLSSDTSSVADANDSLRPLRTIEWLADTFFSAIKTDKYESLKPLMPPFKKFLVLLDSTQAAENSKSYNYISYQRVPVGISRQHKRLVNGLGSCKKMEIKAKECKIDSTVGKRYAYIKIMCAKSEKKWYVISVLTVEIEGEWYIVDELSFRKAQAGILKFKED